MAITAVAALASAGSVAAGIVAIETIATIAAVVSVVGTVTDNKTLKKIGMGMGVAAMGASLMTSAGSGATAIGAGEASALGTESTLAATEATNSLASASTNNLLAGTEAMINAPVPVADMGSLLSGAAPLQAPAMASAAPLATEAASQVATQAASQVANMAPTANSAFSAGEIGNIQAPFDTASKIGDVGNLPNVGVSDSKGFFGDAFDKTSAWLDKNKTLANTLTQVGGQMLSGAAKGEAEQRQFDLQKQQMEFNQQQIANQSAVPTLKNNFNPNYVRSGQGIIFNANTRG